MQRVLDIDLDFFVEDPGFYVDIDQRLDATEHPVWSEAEILDFLSDRCGINGPLPGFVTENHGELFPVWRDAIESGVLVPPFHVTHVDAHADLGLGNSGYCHLLTELLFVDPADRRFPVTGDNGMNDGNWLLFALGCRWIGHLEYVFCDGAGGDELPFVMGDFDENSSHLQLPAIEAEEIMNGLTRAGRPKVSHFEPPVSYRSMHHEEFQTSGPFDFICLTRSPPYTPVTADPLFEMIRRKFIVEELLS